MKKVHVVSHSHWDREWYMPFQKHRIKLVDFMDTLIDTLENNPNFKYFHLDGQTIALDDYLEIKPIMFNRIKSLVTDGKLHIGPWYVLQDEYLISAEANVRNMLLGLRFAKKFGEPVRIGYFPDSFGNISQAPQILKGFNIDNAVFGRGINPIAFNNKMVEFENASNSEVIWESPDGSQVLGILMANWYSNGNEIPEDKENAILSLNKRIENAESFATTSRILLMNGCDHQPVQTTIGDIIEEVQDHVDYEIVHSNLVDYINEVKEEVSNLEVVEGELNGQLTDGWWTLTNTASARLYLKQMNNDCQTLLERYVEPFEVLSMLEGKRYEQEFITQSWKYLIQNHPHDSICGCSIDEVHSEMITRFRASEQISEELLERSKDHMLDLINSTTTDKRSITVFNTLGWDRSEVIECIVDFPKESNITSIKVLDKENNSIPSVVDPLGINFKYTLPNNRFRQTEDVNRFKIKFLAENIKALGYKSYSIIPCTEKETLTNSENSDLTFENKYFKIDFNNNGSFNLFHKNSDKLYKNLNSFEDCGDIGNEYIFRAPKDDIKISSLNTEAKISVLKENSLEKVFEIINILKVPVDAIKEKGIRSSEYTDIKLTSIIIFRETSSRIDVKVTIDNTAKDHRITALFPTNIKADSHFAEGHFDVIERNNKPWHGWKNPSLCQKQTNFVDVTDGQVALMVANKGLPEYEILGDMENTISLTVLRSVSELGDWGIFPTPEAQCLGKNIAEYSLIPHEGDYTHNKAYREAYNFNTPMRAYQGNEKKEFSLLSLESDNVMISSLKKGEDNNNVILRVFNLSNKDEEILLKINKNIKNINEVNLNEEKINDLEVIDNSIKTIVGKKQIKTFELIF